MGSETRELTCITCPLGCRLTVVLEAGTVISVAGNSCPRGEAYGRAEMTHPTRTVTTTVPITGSAVARMLPVRTVAPVPQAAVATVIADLAGVRVTSPVEIGAVVLANVAGTGVDVVATRSL